MMDSNVLPIFPLPRFVAFPGHVHQFHIFEPRYRGMIRDCLAHNLELGVVLGERVISRPRATWESPADQLNSNHGTYEPRKICSVGPVELLEVLADGRMIIEVSFERRVRIDGFIQTVPYLLAKTTRLYDVPRCDRAALEDLFDQLVYLAESILGTNAASLRGFVAPLVFEEKELDRLVYGILQWFRPEPSVSQIILEEDDVEKRAVILIHLMRAFLDSLAPVPTPSIGLQGPTHELEDYIVRREDNLIRVDFSSAAHDRFPQ